jgi:hypothetical protein
MGPSGTTPMTRLRNESRAILNEGNVVQGLTAPLLAKPNERLSHDTVKSARVLKIRRVV